MKANKRIILSSLLTNVQTKLRVKKGKDITHVLKPKEMKHCRSYHLVPPRKNLVNQSCGVPLQRRQLLAPVTVAAINPKFIKVFQPYYSE